MIAFLQDEMGVRKIRFPETSGIGDQAGLARGHRAARAARRSSTRSSNDRSSVTLVHKGNIMKFTEGAFRDWGYALAAREFGAEPLDGGPWMSFKNPTTGREIVIKDMIADAFLQQILLRPREYDVIATTNLNGDYISDALAAQVGGIGIAPGANLVRRRRVVRGDARHRAEVRGPGQGQSGLADPLGRDDAAPPRLARGGRPDRLVARGGDRATSR